MEDYIFGVFRFGRYLVPGSAAHACLSAWGRGGVETQQQGHAGGAMACRGTFYHSL